MSKKQDQRKQPSRGQAARASRQKAESASKKAVTKRNSRAKTVFRGSKGAAQGSGQSQTNGKALTITPLGGLGEVGKNLNVIEYGDDAIVVDAGLKLGVDLPGINYAIPQLDYLKKIKHKIRGYVFTHGHLDHVGAMPFVLPIVNAPCYGSHFTLGMLERIVKDRDVSLHIDKRTLNPDAHDRVQIGPFKIELVRVTHSIPDACAAVIDTPVGRILHTGDFRIDPNPVDGKKVDSERLRQLGQEGVLLLLSDSTGCEKLGHTISESEIEPTLSQLINQSSGRVVISAASTNINRVQMIINAAIEANRKVALDGRSMLANLELAIQLGFAKIPSGTIVPMRDVSRIPEGELAIVSTGHQGEEFSALDRMASGDHKHVKLKLGDTVIFSASPIPGNEKSVVRVVDRLMREGAQVYQHVTREVDETGHLHVSGHGSRDELTEMINLTQPKFFLPIHGEYHHQVRHAELAADSGMSNHNIIVADNGDRLELTADKFRRVDHVPGGALLIDQSGSLVQDVVIKDRLLMSEDGIVVVILTLHKRSGELLSSPDIITRGFIYMRENEELMKNLRNELRHFTARRSRKVEIDRFKQELRDDVNQFLYRRTERSPLIIPVVNVVESAKAKAKARSRS